LSDFGQREVLTRQFVEPVRGIFRRERSFVFKSPETTVGRMGEHPFAVLVAYPVTATQTA
jgi:hypothetical protein